MTLKGTVSTLIGVVGSALTTLFGGWSTGLTTLLIFMCIDYITGLIVAGVFKKSPKTANGALESLAGFKGLIRKGAALLAVLVGYRLDMLLGTAYIRDCVIIAFITNEVISITENAGLMGVPMPQAITKAIDILKGREENNA